jgi:hypothetical protein
VLFRSPSLDTFNKLMFWAASTLAFFALLRVSELVSPAPRAPHQGLRRGHVQVHASKLVVNISASKTDPFRRGQSVLVGSISSSLCPVLAISRYLAHYKAPYHAPLFCFSDGKPLTARKFNIVLHKLLGDLGTDKVKYTSHSFRRGFATCFSKTGLPEHQLQLAGRWNSTCYKNHYIDLQPTTQLALSQAVYMANK